MSDYYEMKIGDLNDQIKELDQQLKETIKLNRREITTVKVWFDAVEDLNPLYLCKFDYRLAEKLYIKLGIKIPVTIINGTGKANAPEKTKINER